MYWDNNKDWFGVGVFYNLLNLPNRIYNDDNLDITYSYSAKGAKLRENYAMGAITDYIGRFVYKNGVLDYIITSEGRAVFFNGNFCYNEFHVKDHLGNVRVTFKNSNGYTHVLQQTDYYAFGGIMQTYNNPYLGTENQYRYNGKEEIRDIDNDWSFLDYGARMYDPQLGRWHSIDPLAEVNRKWSPYTYCYNNPLRFIDPDGMNAEESDDEKKKKEEEEKRRKETEQILINYYKSLGFYVENIDDVKEVVKELENRHHSNKENENVFSVEEFAFGKNKDGKSNDGQTRSEIISQRGYEGSIDSRPKGPEKRYVQDPLSDAVIDMRHMLVVGFFGPAVGNRVETIQGIRNDPSAYDAQDYFSNALGYAFYEKYGDLLRSNPTYLSKCVYAFLNDPAYKYIRDDRGVPTPSIKYLLNSNNGK